MADGERDRAYAEFFFKKVIVDFEAPRQSELALARFQAELERGLPECAALSAAQVRTAGLALGSLIVSRVAEPVGRAELVAALREAWVRRGGRLSTTSVAATAPN